MAVGWWPEVLASAQSTMPKMSSDASGSSMVSGVSTTALNKLVSEAFATQLQTGQADSAFRPVTSQAYGVSVDNLGLAVTSLKKLISDAVASQVQSGAAATDMKKLINAAAGAQSQSGSLASTLSKLLAGSSGVQLVPPVFDVINVGSDSTGTMTCSVTATAGDDVVAFVNLGGNNSIVGVTYGASNLKMQPLARLKFGTGNQMTAVYGIRNVAAGAATITATRTAGSSWGQVTGVAYKSSNGFGVPKTAFGSGTAMSHAVTVPAGNISVEQLAVGGDGVQMSALSGGVSRALDNASFANQSVREASADATFAATLNSSHPWASIAVPVLGAANPGPRINDVGGMPTASSFGASASFNVTAAVDDYVFVDLIVDRAGSLSTITCAGTAMTLVDSQTFTGAAGNATLLRYRSAKITSAGVKSVAIGAISGNPFWISAGVSISGITTIGSTSKTSGSSSAPSQVVSAPPTGGLILHAFGMMTAAFGLSGAAAFYDSFDSGSAVLVMDVTDVASTIALGNTGINWAGLATVLS